MPQSASVVVKCCFCGTPITRRADDAARGDSACEKHFHLLQRNKRKGKTAGHNHHRWKGGTTEIVKAIRVHPKGRLWSDQVLMRDRYRCVRCGSPDAIQVHHKKELAELVDKYQVASVVEAAAIPEFWNVDNGETLCDTCHKREHAVLGAQDA